MRYAVILSLIAFEELQDSHDWYEEQVDGLGEKFVEIVDKAMEVIAINPTAFPKRKHFREIVLDKYPYVIVYEVSKHHKLITVLHVFHTSRNPKHKRKRK